MVTVSQQGVGGAPLLRSEAGTFGLALLGSLDQAAALDLLDITGGGGGGSGSAMETHEETAASSGAQAITLPLSASWAAVSINGLRTSAANLTLVGTSLTIDAGAAVLSGDELIVDYAAFLVTTDEVTAVAGGAQSLTLGHAPSWATFYINGMKQSQSLQTITGTTFDILAGAGVAIGDLISVDYQ